MYREGSIGEEDGLRDIIMGSYNLSLVVKHCVYDSGVALHAEV